MMLPMMSSELTLRATALGLQLVSDVPLLNLACRPPGKGIRPNVDFRWHLEPSKLLGCNSLQLLGSWYFLAGFHDDCHSYNFTKRLIGHAHCRYLGDGGVVVDGMFHLTAGDVLAAPDDDVLRPVCDVHQTVLVEHAEVTCSKVEFAVFVEVEDLGRLVWLSPILLHDLRAAKANLPHLSRRQLLVVFVQDDGLQVEHRKATRRGTQWEQGPGHNARDRVGFCHPEASSSLCGLEGVVDSFDHRSREVGATATDGCEGGGVVLVQVLVVRDVVGVGGNADQVVDSLFLNDLQRPLGFPLEHHAELRAQAHRSKQGDVGPVDVEERRRNEDYRLVALPSRGRHER
mmetsp:Transcript_25391/g.55237  ORF Transcript_25391/g.55237 Transcript_25391/m.55237 type:complete len:344 (-) Transcript_25391:1006-2037(-)